MLLTEFEPDFFLPRYHEYIASLSGSKRSRAEIKLATRGDDALASRLDAGGGNKSVPGELAYRSLGSLEHRCVTAV